MIEREKEEIFSEVKPRDLLRYFISHGFINTRNGDMELLTKSLSRLASATPGQYGLSPHERLKISLEAAYSPPTVVARRHNLHNLTVKTAMRDTVASMVYMGKGNSPTGLDGDIAGRVSLLEKIEERLTKLKVIRQSDAIAKALEKLPHVRDLVDCYLEFGTVRYLLDTLSVPYASFQLWSVYRLLDRENPPDALNGITALAKRFLFASWLRGRGAYVPYDADKFICQAAVLLFADKGSHHGTKTMSNRISSMRAFLADIMRQEFDEVVANNKGKKGEEVELFPRADGYPAQNRQEIDMLKAYKAFGKKGYSPVSLTKFAERVINAAPQEKRVAFILSHSGEFYSYRSRAGLNWAGIKFLENVLSHQRQKIDFGDFTKDTSKILKEAKRQSLQQ